MCLFTGRLRSLSAIRGKCCRITIDNWREMIVAPFVALGDDVFVRVDCCWRCLMDLVGIGQVCTCSR